MLDLKRNNMNSLVVALPLFVLMAGCTVVDPGANEEAVLIEKPYIFGHGGIDPVPVTTGRSYAALSTSYIIVGVQPARQDEKFEDLMTGDNVPLTFDAFPPLQVTDSVMLIKNFGVDWYKNNLEQKFRNIVRDEAKKHSMTELISGAVVQDMELATAASLRMYVEAQKVPIRTIDVTISKINPPKEVMDSIKTTAEQQQRIKTEGQRKLAEDARMSAELSRATADKTYVEHMGLTGQQFVSLEQIRMCGEKSSCTVILGGSAVQPLVNIK